MMDGLGGLRHGLRHQRERLGSPVRRDRAGWCGESVCVSWRGCTAGRSGGVFSGVCGGGGGIPSKQPRPRLPFRDLEFKSSTSSGLSDAGRQRRVLVYVLATRPCDASCGPALQPSPWPAIGDESPNRLGVVDSTCCRVHGGVDCSAIRGSLAAECGTWQAEPSGVATSRPASASS